MATAPTTPKSKEPLYSVLKKAPVHEHIISALVENRPGVLAHISGMFAARGFNIASLAVGATSDSTVSRMTIVCIGDDRVVEQIIKQLRKIIDVIRVLDLRDRDHVERELILRYLAKAGGNKRQAARLLNLSRTTLLDKMHRLGVTDAA